MKVLKTIFALSVSLPMVLIPVRYLTTHNANFEILSEGESQQVDFQFDSFGSDIWMLENLSFYEESTQTTTDLFTYKELMDVMPEGWELPTLEQATRFLSGLGFDQEIKGIIPREYYKLRWQYPGYVDPIVGKSFENEKLFIWIKDGKDYNYISIKRGELTYQLGKTINSAKMSAILVRK